MNEKTVMEQLAEKQAILDASETPAQKQRRVDFQTRVKNARFLRNEYQNGVSHDDVWEG